jgi:hypothetical protein
MSELSNAPSDKLQAALDHDRPDPDDDFGVAYQTACQHWFDRLTEGERSRLATVLAAYERGAERQMLRSSE